MGFARVHGHRLLAHDVLALRGAFQGNLVVHDVGNHHHDDVDVGMGHHFTPVGGDERGAVLASGGLQQIAATRAHGDDVELLGDLAHLAPIRHADVSRRADDAYLESHGST